MKGFACMKLLSEVYLGPRNNLIHFGNDPDYDPGSESMIRISIFLPINEVYQDTDISNRISDQVVLYEAHNIHHRWL